MVAVLGGAAVHAAGVASVPRRRHGRVVTRSMAGKGGSSSNPFEFILGGLRNLFSKADDANADFSSRPVGYSASPGRPGATKKAIKKAEKPLPRRK